MPSTLFDGFAVHQVALFLRFLYHPQDIPANITYIATSDLHTLAHLAHKFAVSALLAAIEAQLAQPSRNSNMQEVGDEFFGEAWAKQGGCRPFYYIL